MVIKTIINNKQEIKKMKITGKVAARKDRDKKKESMDSIYKVENQLDTI